MSLFFILRTQVWRWPHSLRQGCGLLGHFSARNITIISRQKNPKHQLQNKLDGFFFFKCLPTKWARLWSVWFTLGATRLDVWRSADGHMAVNGPRDVMHERSIWCRSAGGSVTPGPRLDWDVRGWCGCVQCVPLNETPPVDDLPWTKTRSFFPFPPQYNFLMDLCRVTITLHLLDKNCFPFLLSVVPWSDKFDYMWQFE